MGGALLANVLAETIEVYDRCLCNIMQGLWDKGSRHGQEQKIYDN